MKKSTLIILACWTAVLLLVLLYAAMPLLIGEDVYVQSQPVDPRDLFLGDYVILSYEFSTVSSELFNQGDPVYVALAPNGTGPATIVSITKEKPDGLYLRGTAGDTRWDNQRTVDFGIERYYIPVGTGRDILPPPYVVHLKVTGSGDARVIELLKDGQVLVFESE